MRRAAARAAVLALALLPGWAGAQDAGAPGAQPAPGMSLGQELSSDIVVISQERLVTETRMARAAAARYEADGRALLAENREIEAALEEEEQDLTSRRPDLPPADFQALAAAFDARVEEIRLAQDSKSRALTRARDLERQRLFEAAAPILAEIMAERGAVAIVDRSAIVLSFDRIDITDAAIARLDEVLGDGTDTPDPDGAGEESPGDVPAPAPTPDDVPAPAPGDAPAPPPAPANAPASTPAPGDAPAPVPTPGDAPGEAPAPGDAPAPLPLPAPPPGGTP